MKFASTSAAIMYNSIWSGKLWKTPSVSIKRSDRRSFILILDWMLVNATLPMGTNLSPYPRFCKTEWKKPNQIYQSLWHIDNVTNSKKNMYNSVFLISANWLSTIIVCNVFCSRFFYHLFYIWQIWFLFNK